MTYCQTFINSFKENSQKIIKEYKVNESNLSIGHINFIVVGRAGIGKSAFINQSLLLDENKKAMEGKGTSITEKSNLYTSEKLKMVRMWDTQGLDYKISQEYILSEIKRLVEDGLHKGPDHYINIILYCTSGNRFQEEDGQLIHKIMKLYPMDNLPVIITQLQAYFSDDAKEMENIIREVLARYLEHNIVKKIEIKSLVSRDKIVGKTTYKAYGIPELLRCSFDIMGRAITSATFKKFSQDIENLCKTYVDKKIDYIQGIFKYEIEILEVAKSNYIDDSEKYFINEIKKQKELSNLNIYKNNTEKDYFIKNFIVNMSSKFIEIFNNLNNSTLSIQSNDKPLVLIFIQQRLESIQKILNDCSKNVFEEKYKDLFKEYLSALQMQQSSRNKQFNTKSDIIDSFQINKNFKEELFQFFKNEFFKYFYCIILKLFMNNLKNILIQNYQKELKENEKMTNVINQKAEYSLKFVTQKLKENLLKDLEKYFPKNEKEDIKQTNNNNNEIKYDFSFPEY